MTSLLASAPITLVEPHQVETLEAGHGHGRRWPTRHQLLVVAFVLLTLATAALAVLTVHYRGKADRPMASPAPAPSATKPPASPKVTRRTVRLLRGHVTVQLVAVVMPDAAKGRLSITAHVSHGIPRYRYDLSGGICPGGREHVWVRGVTDNHGDALLTGPIWVLPAIKPFYVSVDPQPLVSGPNAPITGIAGILISGQATPLVGQQEPCL